MTQNWLQNPETFEGDWASSLRAHEERIQVLERLNTLLTTSEEEFLNKERQNLEESLKFLENFANSHEGFIQSEERNIQDIKGELAKISPEHEKIAGHSRKIAEEVQEYSNQIANLEARIKSETDRRQTLVSQIKPAELASLKFGDMNHPSHDVFKWVLEAVYGTSKTEYHWDNFKKAAFKTDKGVDFLSKLKSFSVENCRKESILSATEIFGRQEAILESLEAKKKQNPSLRSLLEYIGSVGQSGSIVDQVNNDKIEIAKRREELEKVEAEAARHSQEVKSLEDRVASSSHFITELRRLAPIFENAKVLIRDRLNFQGEYLLSVQGKGELRTSVTSQIGQQQNQIIQSQGQVNQTQGHALQQRPVEPQDASNLESPQKMVPLEHAKEERGEIIQQEVIPGSERKPERSQVPPTDLKESEFANSKKGSCETCSIF